MNTIERNRLRDLYLQDGGNIIFIPQGWCDEWEQDKDEPPECMTYAAVGIGANGPVDNLFIPIETLDRLLEVSEETARKIHPKLFDTLARINAGEDVRMGE